MSHRQVHSIADPEDFGRRIVDATTDQAGAANALLDLWRHLDTTVVDASRSGIRADGQIARSPDDLKQELAGTSWPSSRPEPQWVNRIDGSVELLRTVLDPHLPLVLEKYFPECSSVTVYRVSGGLSGVPLVRVVIPGRPDYYIKFFSQQEEFRNEWRYHEAARRWLEEAAVRLVPVRDLDRDGTAQIRAFPRDGLSYFPVCYESGKQSQTLKELYRQGADGNRLTIAYRSVIKILARNQPRHSSDDTPLMSVPFCGPSQHHGTLLGAMRSAEYREKVQTAIAATGRYLETAIGKPVDWNPLLELLNGSDPQWITNRLPKRQGKAHGDANSRNFLIPSGGGVAQIIDCGAFHESAPRLFDLAQMESDLIINLTAIEDDAPGYGEIDTRLLPSWLRQQTAAIESIHGWSPVRRSPVVLAKPYKVVGCIREAVISLSDNDPDHCAYYFFLLYWMMRKLHLQKNGLPHVKTAVALFSACAICRRFSPSLNTERP